MGTAAIVAMLLASLATSAISTGVGLYSAKKTREYNTQEREAAQQFNAEQAKIQRDWEEQMSNSAVSRRVDDMKNAGINPVLASEYSANVPSAAAASSRGASASPVRASDPSGSLINFASSVLMKSKTRSELLNEISNSANTAQRASFAVGDSYLSADERARARLLRSVADASMHSAIDDLYKRKLK